jgi:ketosteroid isomerase-like protein
MTTSLFDGQRRQGQPYGNGVVLVEVLALATRRPERDTARAMSQENVEVVRGVYERWSEGDFRASVDLLDPHVVLVLDPEFAPYLMSNPDEGAFYGIEAVAAYTRDILEPMTHLTMEAEEIVAAGDSVLVSVRQRGVGSTSGVPTEMRYFTLWTFRGRRVIRIESFRERAEALEAAGLRE